ncbi:hypothetical protein [Persicobacter diffluens]
MNKIFNTLSFSLLLALMACGEQLELPESAFFMRILGNNGHDEAVALQTNAASEIYLAGNLSDGDKIFWSKLDQYGVATWDYIWGDSSQQEMANWTLVDGKMLATGKVVDDSGQSHLALWQMNSSSGAMEAAGFPVVSTADSWGQNVIQTANGGTFIAGNFRNANETHEGSLYMLLNSAEEVQWTHMYSQLQPFDQIIGMREVADGYQVLGNVISEGRLTVRIVQLNTDGLVAWSQTLRDQPVLNAVAISWEGALIRVLATQGVGNEAQKVILNFSEEGKYSHKTELPQDYPSTAADLLLDPQGFYFVLSSAVVDARDTDCVIQKFDASFELIWEQQYGSDWQDKANKLFYRSSGPGFLATINFDNKNENANTKMAVYALDQEGVLK